MTDAATNVRENLTRVEAQERASRITDVATEVALDLDQGPDRFGSRTELRFTVVEAGPTFVDLTAVSVPRVELDGEEHPDVVVEPTRLVLPELTAGPHRLTVDATMEYRHEGRGLHRFVDPTDDRVYLHSQNEPFEAHQLYACFDQPDLKTTFALKVDAPAEWVVVSNASTVRRPPEGEAGRWEFATTPRISPYITAVVAGSYVSVHDTYVRDDGSTTDLGLYVRRSLAEHLEHEELFTVTRQALAAFESTFAQVYPFGKYDQLFVPEFSAGAMENPGCVTFSEAYVFRSKVTDALRERRAETLIHEMAHMWFGDLVTMRWFDDLWLNESFATFMAVHIQALATRWSDAWVTFLDAEKAWAKMQDQLPSTHPVADQMPDIESVHQNFDGITYAKGASVLRQLVAWVGHDEFMAGCREYFARHAWGNTTLDDFLGALERASGRDLAAWRDEWLLTTGVNTLAARFEVGDDGTYRSFSIEQTAPLPRWAELPGVDAGAPVLRRHRVAVGLYDHVDGDLVRTARVELDVAGADTEVAELLGTRAADVVLVNDDDLTYAKVALDPATTSMVTGKLSRFTAPMPRALVWSSAWDMVRDTQLPARRYVELVRANVAAEDQIGVLQRLLARALGAAERYGAPRERMTRLRELAVSARAAIEQVAPASDHQLAWVLHWSTVARGDERQLADIQALLDGSLTFEGLSVDTDLRWHLVVCLAHAGVIGDDDIDAELARDDTDIGQRKAATARAAQPTSAAKEAAWAKLLEDTSLSHTMSRQIWAGFNQLDQSELLTPYVERYFGALDDVWAQRSLEWAIEFATAMFPHAAANPSLLERVDRELSRADLPRPLRRVLLEQRDTLARTVDARALDADHLSIGS